MAARTVGLASTSTLSSQPTLCAAGAGYKRDEYCHWRQRNDIYNDSFFGRSSSRAAPPLFCDKGMRAAGVPGEKPPLVIMPVTHGHRT
jgi:hypothetical protein